jgi:hypothetical protein
MTVTIESATRVLRSIAIACPALSTVAVAQGWWRIANDDVSIDLGTSAQPSFRLHKRSGQRTISYLDFATSFTINTGSFHHQYRLLFMQ